MKRLSPISFLQQQYRQRNFTKYLELISILLTIEKTNKLLLKKHDLRPTEFTTVPEAHANTHKSFGPSRGRGCKQDKGFRMSGSRSSPYNRKNPRKQNRDIGKKPTRK